MNIDDFEYGLYLDREYKKENQHRNYGKELL
jgi:hypothetical protein